MVKFINLLVSVILFGSGVWANENLSTDMDSLLKKTNEATSHLSVWGSQAPKIYALRGRHPKNEPIPSWENPDAGVDKKFSKSAVNYELSPEEKAYHEEIVNLDLSKEFFEAYLKRLKEVFPERRYTRTEVRQLAPLILKSLEFIEAKATSRYAAEIETIFSFIGMVNSEAVTWDWPFAQDNRVPKNLAKNLESTVKVVSSRHVPLKSIDELSFLNGQGLVGFQEELEKRIVGQPQVIQELLAERERQILFRKETPFVLGLMGLSSTGRKTAAKSFVNAIYKNDLAHEDHMKVINEIMSTQELWEVFGSATGHVGSDQISPVIKWLVQHSGGRYQIASKGQTRRGRLGRDAAANQGAEYIIENKAWFKGEVLSGYSAPEDAVLFLNGFHKWAKSAKDGFYNSLTTGWFPIKSPNGGLDRIHVPVNIFISTDDGMDLIVSRDINGVRSGPPLKIGEMISNWDEVHSDETLLKQSLMQGNDSGGSSLMAKGTSEDFAVNAFSSLVLMKPLTEDALKAIIKKQLNDFSAKLNQSRDFFAELEIQWDPGVIDFIQEYRYEAEENARPIVRKINNLIEKPFFYGIRKGLIPVREYKKGESLTFKFVANADKTTSLSLTFAPNGKEVILPIEYTEVDRLKEPLAEDRIKELLTLSERLQKHVFGATAILEKVAKSILLNEEERSHKDAKSRAQIFMALGPSSTGKTETAKAIAREYLHNEDSLLVINFNQVKSPLDMENLFFGRKDPGSNKVSKSLFMKHLDRTRGKAVVVLDEFSNAPTELTMQLYDLFRESSVDIFADGKKRQMKDVIFFITGNAGEEWYSGVPGNIPVEQQMKAFEEIYMQAMRDLDLQRRTLRQRFTEALVARVPERNIFFYPHLSLSNIRQLANHSFTKLLKRLEPRSDGWGWYVKMRNMKDYEALLKFIEEEEFTLRRQGASVVDFIDQELALKIKSLLLGNLVPKGSSVALRVDDSYLEKKSVGDFKQVKFTLEVEQSADPSFVGRSLDFSFNIKNRVKEKFKSDNQIISIGYHESGHAVVNKLLFWDYFDITEVSIRPGVAPMGDEWILYEGVQKTDQINSFPYSREAFLRTLAGLLAGTVAQEIITKGKVEDAGKSNDIQRATSLARSAILQAGLGKKWGDRAIPFGVKEEDYLSSLSNEDKKLLKEEEESLINEARNMARQLLVDNFDTLSELAVRLVEKGVIVGPELTEFFEGRKYQIALNHIDDNDESRIVVDFHQKKGVLEEVLDRIIEPQFYDFVPLPKRVARSEELLLDEREVARAKVELSKEAVSKPIDLTPNKCARAIYKLPN